MESLRMAVAPWIRIAISYDVRAGGTDTSLPRVMRRCGKPLRRLEKARRLPDFWSKDDGKSGECVDAKGREAQQLELRWD